MEGLRTPIYVIVMAIAMYMCSVGVAMIADVTGKQEKTVERWIRRIAPHCEGLIKQESCQLINPILRGEHQIMNFAMPVIIFSVIFTFLVNELNKEDVKTFKGIVYNRTR